LLQFYFWGRGAKQLFACLAFSGLSIWILDNFILHSLQENNALFRACYAFIVVVLAANRLQKRAMDTRRPLWADPVFLICAGCVIYYSAKAFMEVFNFYHVVFTAAFEDRLFLTMSVLDAFSNLLFTTAIVCTRKNHQYLLPS